MYRGAGSAQISTDFTHDNLSNLSSFSSAPNDWTHNHNVLGQNSLYDLVNTPFDALQAQAKNMDPKKCKEFPFDSQLPGWGGAGYRTHDKKCNRYPASYLGAGLYFDLELCGPLP